MSLLSSRVFAALPAAFFISLRIVLFFSAPASAQSYCGPNTPIIGVSSSIAQGGNRQFGSQRFCLQRRTRRLRKHKTSTVSLQLHDTNAARLC